MLDKKLSVVKTIKTVNHKNINSPRGATSIGNTAVVCDWGNGRLIVIEDEKDSIK